MPAAEFAEIVRGPATRGQPRRDADEVEARFKVEPKALRVVS